MSALSRFASRTTFCGGCNLQPPQTAVLSRVHLAYARDRFTLSRFASRTTVELGYNVTKGSEYFECCYNRLV
jgi:hypothetical protein